MQGHKGEVPSLVRKQGTREKHCPKTSLHFSSKKAKQGREKSLALASLNNTGRL